MPVDPEDLRLAMRNWATGVTIVSSAFDGQRHGMTVSSFTSISLTPPLVLVSLERSTRTHQLVKDSGAFSVTILAADQQEISDRFAGRHTEDQDRFSGLGVHTLETGAPLLDHHLSALDCRVVEQVDLGTHCLFVGEVVGLEIRGEGPPLVYYDRAYHRLQE